ncbi:hypothetical protein BGX34_011925 [Mortierella sp. NVP85]|nr:hypothetical protein BGX34_011925 [Mortierella sp. NVP85]
MLSEQGKPAFDSASFHPSDYSPTLLQQQQHQHQPHQPHFATGHQHQKQSNQQHFHRAARPASEIIPQNPFLANNFQSPEAEAIDKWFEDLSHYEQTLEEMAVVSLDTMFKDELSTIESWFRVLSEAERTAALYSLLQHSSQVQVRFFMTVLQQMAKKDPVGALLSPTSDKDPAHGQLHGGISKAAEIEASQRLLNVHPIQPPASRLYDRHSVTIGQSDEYTRLFRKDKRNSIDFLGRTVTNTTNSSSNSSNSSSSNSNNGSGNKFSTSLNGSVSGSSALNGNVNGVIGSGALSETISARVGQFGKTSPSLSRISPPNTFANRPKSVHEGDASSMFAPSWNFASLGANPLSSSSSASPGHIGDRTSYGRPKSVGGAEWLLSGASTQHRASVTEGLVDKSWSPLMMSPNMGGFHNGTNGSGHSLSANGFSSSGSGLAVERPKSVAEGDFSQLHMSQWGNNNNNAGGNNGSRTSTLEELKANNRRRTMLRPSAIISNVPVTVMEGDEKLLSASANTSSINIVSTMFNETSGAGSGSSTMSELAAGSGATALPSSSTATATSAAISGGGAASQGNASIFSYAGATQPPSSLSSYQLQQQQAVQQLQNLTLDLSTPFRPSQPPPQPRSRASSPFASPLPSPIKAGFRSRPVSGPTSPRLPAQQHPPPSSSAWGPTNGNHQPYYNHGLDGRATVPMDYNQKRHLSPPHQQRPPLHHHSSLDDDYLSDTSDISSLGMNGHHGRSAAKEKKQPEGVDFDLLQTDTPAWLRSLRLHKYNSIFEGMPWREIVNLSDGDLINKGVAALGARRKMLKVFEQVRKEMLLQGMVI